MRRGTALVLGSAVLWGTTFPATKWGLIDLALSPAAFLFWRFLVAALVLAAIAAWRRRLHFEYFLDWRLWLYGLLNGVGYVLQFEGQSITTASKTSLLVNVNVLITAVCAWVFLKESIGRGVWVGLVLGTIGITLLTTDGEFTVLSDEIVGDAMGFGTGVCWTIVILGYKRFLQRNPDADPITMNLVVFGVGILVFFVGGFVSDGLDLPLTRSSVGLVGYLGVFATTFAFLAWQEGLKHLGASVSSVLLLFEALVALALSMAFLGERFGIWSGAGALLVLAALYLASRSPPEPAAVPTPQPGFVASVQDPSKPPS